MSYLLDTNTCVEYLRHGKTSPVSATLAAVLDSDVVICTVVLAELRFGVLPSSDPSKNLADVQNFVMIVCPVNPVAAQVTRRRQAASKLPGPLARMLKLAKPGWRPRPASGVC